MGVHVSKNGEAGVLVWWMSLDICVSVWVMCLAWVYACVLTLFVFCLFVLYAWRKMERRVCLFEGCFLWVWTLQSTSADGAGANNWVNAGAILILVILFNGTGAPPPLSFTKGGGINSFSWIYFLHQKSVNKEAFIKPLGGVGGVGGHCLMKLFFFIIFISS